MTSPTGTITVYRGALRDSDGYPVLERAYWTQVVSSHPDGVELPASLGLDRDVRWKFHSGSDLLSVLPVRPQQTDVFGTITDFGGLDSRVDLYNLPVMQGMRIVSFDTWLLGYEEYRQVTDPVGIPAMGQPGSTSVPVLYVEHAATEAA